MASYYAFIPPQSESENPIEDYQLIEDGKAKWALIFPFIWLIWHRLWLPLIVYVVLTSAIMGLIYMHPNVALSYLPLLINVYFFLEGNQLRVNKLEHQGWGLVDIVNGANEEEAALRFLSQITNITSNPIPKIQSSSLTQDQKPVFKPSPATGLFPE